MDVRLAKAYLESTLMTYIRPHFLSIEQVDKCIHVVLCHPKFKSMSTPARIKLVADLFKVYNATVVQTFLVVIEVYDSEQMNLLLEEKL